MRILWSVLVGGGFLCMLAYARSRGRQRNHLTDDLGTVSDQWRAETESRSGGSDY